MVAGMSAANGGNGDREKPQSSRLRVDWQPPNDDNDNNQSNDYRLAF
jgi:hypothetical protein